MAFLLYLANSASSATSFLGTSSSPGAVKGVVGCEGCAWGGGGWFPRLLGQKQQGGLLTELCLRLPVTEPGVPA